MAETLKEPEDPYKYYPTLLDWDSLQDGKPRVFCNPHKRATSKWVVLHVYDEHLDSAHRFACGLVVDTIPPELDNIPMSRLIVPLKRPDADSRTEHDIIVPSMMRRDVHGDPCETRSLAISGDIYPRISNQKQYEQQIRDLQDAGMQEIIFGVQDGVLKMFPLAQIRPARPLAPTPAQPPTSKN